MKKESNSIHQKSEIIKHWQTFLNELWDSSSGKELGQGIIEYKNFLENAGIRKITKFDGKDVKITTGNSEPLLSFSPLTSALEYIKKQEIEIQKIDSFKEVFVNTYEILKKHEGEKRAINWLKKITAKHRKLVIQNKVIDYLEDKKARTIKYRNVAFLLSKKIIDSLLDKSTEKNIENIQSALKKTDIETFEISLKDKEIDFREIYLKTKNLPEKEITEQVRLELSRVVERCISIFKKNIDRTSIKDTIEKNFQYFRKSGIVKEEELLSNFKEIIKSTPEETLEKEKLKLLSREELEQKVKERTAELRKAYEELKELDEMKDNFIAMSAHELKTPITVMRANIDLLLQNLSEELNEDNRDLLQEIELAIRRQEKSVEKILEASRIESGSLKLEKTNVDLSKLIQEILEEKSKKIELETEIEKSSKIKADKEKIRFVLSELIDNAIQYRSENKKIRIFLEEKSGKIKFSINNPGNKIPKKETKRIFQKFHQIDHSQEGCGLGLNICKSLIEAHDGEIWVESNDKKGTTFYFTLPPK